MFIPIQYDAATVQDPASFPKNWTCGQPSWAEKALEADITVSKDPISSTATPYGNYQMRFPDACDYQVITVGPVIGYVDHKSARILIECAKDGIVTCTVSGMSGNMKVSHQRAVEVEVVGGVPKTFKVTKLKPEFKYAVHFDVPVYNLVGSSFRTAPDPRGLTLADAPFSFAVVSSNSVCTYQEPIPVGNKPGERPKPVLLHRRTHAAVASLWKDLYHQVMQGEIRYLFHVGNNIQIGGESSVFKHSSDMRTDDHQTRELFRNEYRTQWNEPWIKHTLANVPNIMVLNETDIGNFIHVPDTELNDMNRAEIAFEVYKEYQQSLSRDPKEHEMDGEDFGCHWAARLAPKVSVLVLDFRCIPTFGVHRSCERGTLMGDKQMKKIRKTLEKLSAKHEGGEYPSSALIVLSTTNMADRTTHLYAKEHVEQFDEVLKTIFNWRDIEGARNSREIGFFSAAECTKFGELAEIVPSQNNEHYRPAKEYAVGPMTAMQTLRVPYVPVEMGSTPNFSFKSARKLPKFAKYMVCKIGGSRQSTDKREDAQYGYFQVERPVFWAGCRYVAKDVMPDLKKSSKKASLVTKDLTNVQVSKDSKVKLVGWDSTLELGRTARKAMAQSAKRKGKGCRTGAIFSELQPAKSLDDFKRQYLKA